MKLRGKTLAITGGAGFIGSRTIERAKERGMTVRALDLSEAVRERGADEALVGDVADASLCRRLCEGADFVFHTAAKVGAGGELAAFRRANVAATALVGEAARAAGVACLVHMSSVMVYGFDFPPWVTEAGPLRGEGDAYCQTKIESEGVLKAFADRMRIVLFRAGDVYGPAAGYWVIQPIEQMKKRRFALPDGGAGTMNHLYVDNLIDALFLALENDDAVGPFTLTDGAATSFKTYFDLLAHVAGAPAYPCLPAGVMKVMANVVIGGDGTAAEGPEIVDYLRRPHPYSIDRARRELGYAPTVLLEEGMAKVRAWLRSQ